MTETASGEALDSDLRIPVLKHLIHVVCLPLQIKRKLNGRDASIASLEEVALAITAAGSAWRSLSDDNTPWSTPELTPEQRWQARVYFHPFVRRFLYDPTRVSWLQRNDIKDLQVKLPIDSVTVTLNVRRCLLALFQPDSACLLLELEYQAGSVGQPDPLSLSTLQRLLDRVRRTYPPYFDTLKDDDRPLGGHSPASVTLRDTANNPIGATGLYVPDAYQDRLQNAGQVGSWKPAWAEHWNTLLAPLRTSATPADGWGVRQFGDDRAAIMTYVAMNDVRLLNRGQWVRLCFADDAGTDPLPYAERFLKKFEEMHCYERYWYNDTSLGEPVDGLDAPSRILNCGYAFTYAGNHGTWTDKQGRTQPNFFSDPTNGALFTFRHIYVFMGLIVHMQRAKLLAASQQLTELVSRQGDDIELPDLTEVRRFYDQFVEFTQTYWFDEITPQEQGQQIFDQWKKHLRIQPMYDEVRQELRDLREYSDLKASAEQNDQAGRLNQAVGVLGAASVFLAMLSLIAGILGMNDPKFIWGWLALPTGVLFSLLGLLLYRLYRVRSHLISSIPVIHQLWSEPSKSQKGR